MKETAVAHISPTINIQTGPENYCQQLKIEQYWKAIFLETWALSLFHEYTGTKDDFFFFNIKHVKSLEFEF